MKSKGEHPRVLLIIPSRDLRLAERCIHSFHESMLKTDSRAIILYTGNDENFKSDDSNPGVYIVGYNEAKILSEVFAEIAKCSPELLFGKQEYFRSYGGASNFVLALGESLGFNLLGKIDDDCLEFRSIENSWLAFAKNLIGKNHKIIFLW